MVEPEIKDIARDLDSIPPSCKTCGGETSRDEYKLSNSRMDTLFKFTCQDESCADTFIANLRKFIRKRSKEEINEDIDPDSNKDRFNCECGLTVSVNTLQRIGIGTEQHPIQKYKCSNPKCQRTIVDRRNRKAKRYLYEEKQPTSQPKIVRLQFSEMAPDEVICEHCGKKKGIITVKTRNKNNKKQRVFGCNFCKLKVPIQKAGGNDYLRPTCPECGPEAKVSTIRLKQTKAGKPLFQCTHCIKLIAFEN